MAKQNDTPTRISDVMPPPTKTRTRLVNRNAHLSAAAKIVAILEKVEQHRWAGILRSVQEALAQPLLENAEVQP